MDLFPLWNSLHIAGISTFIIFFLGIFAAYYIVKAPRIVKGILDVVLTLPLVLPPRSWGTCCCACWVPAVSSGRGSSPPSDGS